ncbi:hypothetical protein ACF0H5_018179 [Mactra antiquata]
MILLTTTVVLMVLPAIHCQIMADLIIGPPSGMVDIGGMGGGMVGLPKPLNIECSEKCKTEVCYLAHPTDCRKFIVCKQGAINYMGTEQFCAFGTFWGGFMRQQKVTCDLPSNVRCNIDYCRGRAYGETFDHPDQNCKTYWQCGETGPVPQCCFDGYRYDRRINQCVEDVEGTCRDICPIKVDACMRLGQATDFFDDGNCKTYWDCEDRHPHPVCCPDGMGYVRDQGCVAMPNCRDKCPRQYEPDMCLTAESYPLLDSHCRTFMKCNAVEGDERWCCPSKHVFNATTMRCEPDTTVGGPVCDDICPYEYNQMCPLKPGDTPDTYLQMVHGIWQPMPCAPGTQFDIDKCNCAKKIKNAPDNSCSMELDINFGDQNWIRGGSQKEVKINQLGTILPGPELQGRVTYRFDGNLFFRTPFFRSDYSNLYMNIIYNTDDNARGRRVLLSNCMTIDLQRPSLELSLENGMIQLALVTDEMINNASYPFGIPAVASVPYSPNSWNTFTAIYDGQELLVLNEGAGVSYDDRQSLTGVVMVAAEGLDLGGCYITRDQGQGFVGSVAKLQFSKCLKREWVDNFYNATGPTRFAATG